VRAPCCRIPSDFAIAVRRAWTATKLQCMCRNQNNVRQYHALLWASETFLWIADLAVHSSFLISSTWLYDYMACPHANMLPRQMLRTQLSPHGRKKIAWKTVCTESPWKPPSDEGRITQWQADSTPWHHLIWVFKYPHGWPHHETPAPIHHSKAGTRASVRASAASASLARSVSSPGTFASDHFISFGLVFPALFKPFFLFGFFCARKG